MARGALFFCFENPVGEAGMTKELAAEGTHVSLLDLGQAQGAFDEAGHRRVGGKLP